MAGVEPNTAIKTVHKNLDLKQNIDTEQALAHSIDICGDLWDGFLFCFAN